MPPRLRDVIKALAEHGIEVDKPAGGSHWMCKRKGARGYPIPAHNGPKSEISNCYVRGVCRAFGIDEGEFKKKL